VRIVIGPNGQIAVDAGKHSAGDASTGAGRGAYVHASHACVRGAAQRGLARAARAEPLLDGERVTGASLAAAICDAYARRACGLLGAAKRSRSLEVGADAVTICGRSGEASLIVVAADAAQAASLTEVRRAIAEGRAAVWESKSSLGEIVRGQPTESGVGVVAVTDTRIAAALRETLTIVASLAIVASPSIGSSPTGGSSLASGPGGAPEEKKSEESRAADDAPETEVRGRESRNRGVGSALSEPVDASKVPGAAATFRGFDDPLDVLGGTRVVEWSA